MDRTTEFILGLIGGIFGIIGALFALFIGGIDAAFSESGTSSIIGGGWAAILFSILGIVGSILVKRNAVLGGIFMLIAALGGFISIFMAYVLPGILLAIAGIMGLIRKDEQINENRVEG